MSFRAMFVRFAACAALSFCALFSSCLHGGSACGGEETTAGYLFAHFRGERSNEWEQIFFAISKDGAKWQPLNDGKSVLQSNVGEGGVRDPFVVRDPEMESFTSSRPTFASGATATGAAPSAPGARQSSCGNRRTW